jgi:glucokinase
MFPGSALKGGHGKLNRKGIFAAAASGDMAAAGVVYNYLFDLAEGIVDLINIFRPEKIIIGGGISHADGFPLEPLNEYVGSAVFGGKESAVPIIALAQLGNDAGIIGAARL